MDCKKCSLFKNYDQIDAISKATDFKCMNSRSQYLFRTCSVATSLVTSITLLSPCRAVVNTDWFRNHSSFEHRLLQLLMKTDLYGNHYSLLVQMRRKSVVLLVSHHFQRVKTDEMLLIMMKWAWEWYFFIIFIVFPYLKSCILFFYFTFFI